MSPKWMVTGQVTDSSARGKCSTRCSVTRRGGSGTRSRSRPCAHAPTATTTVRARTSPREVRTDTPWPAGATAPALEDHARPPSLRLLRQQQLARHALRGERIGDRSRVSSRAVVQFIGHPQQRPARDLLQLAPPLERVAGQPHVVGLCIRPAHDASRAAPISPVPTTTTSTSSGSSALLALRTSGVCDPVGSAAITRSPGAPARSTPSGAPAHRRSGPPAQPSDRT